MRALIVIGGEAPGFARISPLLASIDLLCAADSGLDLAHEWGLAPDIIVGDMDSLAHPELLLRYQGAELHRLDRAKDVSDTEAGLGLCHGRGATELILVGGGGGRLDHLLAIRALFERAVRPCEWHLPEDSVYLVEAGRSRVFAVEAGTIVSVFPLAGGSRRMESRGLRWPLAGLEWGPGSYGLSNEATGADMEIAAGEGDLLVVRGWR